MFITAANGDLIASIPTAREMIGKDFGSEYWREQAAAADATFVSAIHPRLSDNRPVTDIVGAVRAPDRTILGYVGVSVLVERIGRRLSTIEFSDRLRFRGTRSKWRRAFRQRFQAKSRNARAEGK